MSEIDPKRIVETKRLSLAVKKTYESCRILDIGGGGEGIISMIYGKDVVAIDKRVEELQELSEQAALKLEMDATKMSFLEAQFDVATAFFTCMYMDVKTVDLTFKEVNRVLKQNGVFEIWDISLPAKSNLKDVFILHLDIALEDRTISTGYGVLMDEHERDILIYTSLLKQYFTDIQVTALDGDMFHIICRKG